MKAPNTVKTLMDRSTGGDTTIITYMSDYFYRDICHWLAKELLLWTMHFDDPSIKCLIFIVIALKLKNHFITIHNFKQYFDVFHWLANELCYEPCICIALKLKNHFMTIPYLTGKNNLIKEGVSSCDVVYNDKDVHENNRASNLISFYESLSKVCNISSYVWNKLYE